MADTGLPSDEDDDFGQAGTPARDVLDDAERDRMVLERSAS